MKMKKCIMKKNFSVTILDNGITYAPGACEVDEKILELYPAIFEEVVEEVIEKDVEDVVVEDIEEDIVENIKKTNHGYPSM